MAWPIDQASWEQDQIYGNPPADLVPPFVPDIGAVATNYGAYLNPSTNDVHQSYRAPHPWGPIAGPNLLDDPITGIINDPPSAGIRPPIVPASSHPEPKPRTRKKTSSRVTEYATLPISPQSSCHPRPATIFECKWEGCQYPGSFNREHDLLRHLRTIHIAPLAHSYPVKECRKVCNREDNLLQHMKNRHGFRYKRTSGAEVGVFGRNLFDVY
jgi:hypothetical protein